MNKPFSMSENCITPEWRRDPNPSCSRNKWRKTSKVAFKYSKIFFLRVWDWLGSCMAVYRHLGYSMYLHSHCYYSKHNRDAIGNVPVTLHRTKFEWRFSWILEFRVIEGSIALTPEWEKRSRWVIRRRRVDIATKYSKILSPACSDWLLRSIIRVQKSWLRRNWGTLHHCSKCTSVAATLLRFCERIQGTISVLYSEVQRIKLLPTERWAGMELIMAGRLIGGPVLVHDGISTGLAIISKLADVKWMIHSWFVFSITKVAS